MKYPLKQHHWIGRELICYFFGHKWKHSKSVKTEYYGMNKKDVPYSYRKSTGNYMWKSLASWSNKCVRCRTRLKENEWPNHPWYKTVKWSVKSFWECFYIAINCLWKSKNISLWKKIIFIPIVGFLFGLEQSWSYMWLDWDWPSFPMSIVCDLYYKLDNWLNKGRASNGVETSLEMKQT